jgi:integrase
MDIRETRPGSGRWQARYRWQGERFSAGTFTTKTAAKTAIRHALNNRENPTKVEAPASATPLFRDFATEVMKQRSHTLKPRTVESYESLMKKWIMPTFGDKRLSDIRRQTVDSWWSLMSIKTPPVNRRNAYMVLRGIMNHAVHYDHIETSPCRVLKASKDVAAPRPYLSIPDFYRIHDECAPWMKTILIVTFGCHLRLGEVVGLNWGDVSLKANTVTVARQAVEAPGGLQLAETKTGTTMTLTPLREAHTALKEHFKAAPSLPDAPLFLGAQGRRIPRGTVRKERNRARAVVGLPDAHLHDLRHTSLTLVAQIGGSTKEIMKRGRHSTMGAAIRYQHATLERDESLAAAASALMVRGA